MTRPPFHYQDDALHCEDVPLATIAAEVGTPTYVYSKHAITSAYRAACAACVGRAAFAVVQPPTFIRLPCPRGRSSVAA